MKNKILIALLFFTALFSACKKDPKGYADFGSLEVEFENRAGSNSFSPGRNYVTAGGDTIQFSKFDYFVSNFVLVKDDGSEYVVPKNECYFLIKNDIATSRTIRIDNVPGGAYKSARFVIGIDSLMSATPAEKRPAALDPVTAASGMYWSWNSGYIFVKIEGTSPNAPINAQTQTRSILYHIGGYGGNDPAKPTMNNLKVVTLTNGELAEVGKLETSGHSHGGGEKGLVPHMHVYTDIMQAFTEPVSFRVAQTPVLHWGDFAKTVANNYKDMFKLDHIHN